jgi:PKHD-type hydroxylase
MNPTGYFIPPMELAREYPSHCQWTGENRAFSAPECDAIIAYGERSGFNPAGIGTPDQIRIDQSYRCVDLCMVPYSPETDWLYQRITQRLQWANEAYWRFDLTGLLEPLQLLRYKAATDINAPAGHYDWHQDFGAGYMGRRKITFIGQLTAGEDYEGCAPTIMSHQQETLSYRNRGDALAFASWTPHMVSPIERGTRYALVAWIHGAPFR